MEVEEHTHVYCVHRLLALAVMHSSSVSSCASVSRPLLSPTISVVPDVALTAMHEYPARVAVLTGIPRQMSHELVALEVAFPNGGGDGDGGGGTG